MDPQQTYTAFEGQKLLFQGTLSEVVLKIKKHLGKADNSSILIFSDENGQIMDFNFQGSEKDILKRLEVYVSTSDFTENTGRGRPKLGVVAREVSLLPRHWEWLATQPGGASATIRKLIDETRKKYETGNTTKHAQERTYKFISAVAGDLEGYEEALRALYKKDEPKFLAQIANWPRDIKKHASILASPVFE